LDSREGEAVKSWDCVEECGEGQIRMETADLILNKNGGYSKFKYCRGNTFILFNLKYNLGPELFVDPE
jgi:hypothetical protein